jgi:hypothetical protein
MKIKMTFAKYLVAGMLAAFMMPVHARTNDMFGVWGGISIKGGFTALNPQWDKIHWHIFNQSRTRDDSVRGSRLSENLLMGQIGYSLNQHASVWVGYAHDWLHPLHGQSFQESRVYEDFLWKQSFGGIHFISRTRMDERINQRTGNDGFRARQLLKLSHAVPNVKGLSFYVGDEVLFYLDKNAFGKQGFSENRVFSGLHYPLSQHMGFTVGYLGQYVSTKQGANLFTHNLQAHITYTF